VQQTEAEAEAESLPHQSSVPPLPDNRSTQYNTHQLRYNLIYGPIRQEAQLLLG